jgi:hypothetical protein
MQTAMLHRRLDAMRLAYRDAGTSRRNIHPSRFSVFFAV